VSPCRQCGANLPDEAKFCLQCGAPVERAEAKPAAPEPPLEFIQPALAGGMFLGLLSSLPFIQAGNCLCCMWVLGGGSIAVFLLSKQRASAVRYGDGAYVGVLSGLFGSIVGTMVSIPVRILSARILGNQQQAIEEAMRDVPGFEGPIRDLILRVASPEISIATLAFTFFTSLLLYSLFAMIGGILTVAILNKRARLGVGG